MTENQDLGFAQAAEYLTRSRRAAKWRRISIIAGVAGLALLTVAAVSAALWAVNAENAANRQARAAESRELAARSSGLLATEPAEAVSLALRALEPAETDEAVAALHEALSQPVLADIARHKGSVSALAVTREGLVVSGGSEGLVKLSDPARPDAEPKQIAKHAGGVSALVTRKGLVVSGGFQDGLVKLSDPARPDAEPKQIAEHAGSVSALAVTDKGWVLSGGPLRVLRVRCVGCVPLGELRADPVAPLSSYWDD